MRLQVYRDKLKEQTIQTQLQVPRDKLKEQAIHTWI